MNQPPSSKFGVRVSFTNLVYKVLTIAYTEVVQVWVFDSEAPPLSQQNSYGCDVTVLTVRKQRGKITKLVRGGCYLDVKEGKARGKSRFFFGAS